MNTVRPFPKDKALEASIPFIFQEGYRFIQNRCEDLDTDVFQTRFMLKRTICLYGEEAAKLFYDNEKFVRKGAAPNRVKASLFGKGGVQGLDEAQHRHRKQMFMSLMTEEEIRRMVDITEKYWEEAIEMWQTQKQITLFYDAGEILFRAVCEWSGMTLKGDEVELRTSDMRAMVEAFGALGPRHWKGRAARRRTERWVSHTIVAIRNGQGQVAKNTALDRVAFHIDLNGNLLDTHTAAVELINILRPTVAIDRFITFAAVALHQNPEYVEKLRHSDDILVENFVQEVRRYYPYAPFVGAKVKKDFVWREHLFPQGALVLLDLYGTNHDNRIWEDSGTFRPERFLEWDKSPYSFMPQGGAEHHNGHRCAGEWITIELMKQAVKFLTRKIEYRVPPQDLTISLTRIPALPESKFIISQIGKIKSMSINNLSNI